MTVTSLSMKPLALSRWLSMIRPSTRGTRLGQMRSRNAAASGPVISNFAKLERSISPTRSRTARHSLRTRSHQLERLKENRSPFPLGSYQRARSQPNTWLNWAPRAFSASCNEERRRSRPTACCSAGL